MAMQTTRTIEIGAAPAEVFSWLVEPDKLKAWTDAESKLPADSSELHVGWKLDSTFQAPDGPREFEFEITAYDPPRELGYMDTYAGGKSTATFRLSESAAGTQLEATMSADTAAPVTTIPDAVRAELAELPEMQRQMAEQQMASAMKQIANYDASSNPQAVSAWQAKVEAELEKLKELVELMEKER